MQELLLSHEGEVYAGCYFLAIALVAAGESVSPRRRLTQPMGLRWSTNILIAIINILLVRSLFPVFGVAFALYVQHQGWGLSRATGMSSALVFLVSIIALDLANYIQHYLLHRVPVLWRLHRMHHSDMDYDFSTALRFHPLEAILSTLVDLLVVLLIGVPAIAYLSYKIVQVVLAYFIHGNLRIPTILDRLLRKVIVTPDLHRIHHSVALRESNSNFGGITPWWDRLFRTYLDQPALGHEKMEVGLTVFRETKHRYLPWMLAQPFLSDSPVVAGE